MKLEMNTQPSLTFIGYYTEIKPEEGYQKCPEFWNVEYAQKYARLWQTMKPENEVEQAILDNQIGMYALCVESKKGFSYWIAGLYQGGSVPEGLELYTFPASDWAMFSTKGSIPQSLQSLNTYIWHEWLPKKGAKYGANAKATVEVYSAGNPQSQDYESGIWIPLFHNTEEVVAASMLL